MRVPVQLASWRKGWWRENVDPALNPEQVVGLLERDAPNHPALPKIRAIVRGWLQARGRRVEYRCGRCEDAGWVWIVDGHTVEGNRTPLAAARCPGLKGPCRADAERLRRARERAAVAKSNVGGTTEAKFE